MCLTIGYYAYLYLCICKKEHEENQQQKIQNFFRSTISWVYVHFAGINIQQYITQPK